MLLKHLFEIYLRKWNFPDKLEIVRVIPLLKAEDTADISNYRPI